MENTLPTEPDVEGGCKSQTAEQTALDKARSRLSVLELGKKLQAEKCGGVREACRLSGMTPTWFYTYRKRYEESGLEGLKDRPPLHKPNPARELERKELRQDVIDLAIEVPDAGCTALEAGVSVSSVTVRKILKEAGLATKEERARVLEAKWREQPDSLSFQQLAFLGKADPKLQQRALAATLPGSLLCQFALTLRLPRVPASMRVHVVLDTFGSMAWASVHPPKRRATKRGTGSGLLLLQNEVMPFYARHRLKIREIQTMQGSDFSYYKPLLVWKQVPTKPHPYSGFLARNGIHHRLPRSLREEQSGPVPANPFARHFADALRAELLSPLLREMPEMDLLRVQSHLRDQLRFYNEERPHPGFPNNGRPPLKFFTDYMSTER